MTRTVVTPETRAHVLKPRPHRELVKALKALLPQVEERHRDYLRSVIKGAKTWTPLELEGFLRHTAQMLPRPKLTPEEAERAITALYGPKR